MNFRLGADDTEAIATRQAQLGVTSRSEFVTVLCQLQLGDDVQPAAGSAGAGAPTSTRRPKPDGQG